MNTQNTHKELVPNSVGDIEERDVPNGYHYELQLINNVWQWVIVADYNKELIDWLMNKKVKND